MNTLPVTPRSVEPSRKSLKSLRAQAAQLTVADMHAFLRARYKHDRFEGRDNATNGSDYSTVVATSTLKHLQIHGFGLVSQHESVTGSVVYYDGALSEIDHETWRACVREELDEV